MLGTSKILAMGCYHQGRPSNADTYHFALYQCCLSFDASERTTRSLLQWNSTFVKILILRSLTLNIVDRFFASAAVQDGGVKRDKGDK